MAADLVQVRVRVRVRVSLSLSLSLALTLTLTSCNSTWTPTSALYLPYISPISALYLPYTSPLSPQFNLDTDLGRAALSLMLDAVAASPAPRPHLAHTSAHLPTRSPRRRSAPCCGTARCACSSATLTL